jgi:hypothetical protein
MYTAKALETAKNSPECDFIRFIGTSMGLASLRTAGFHVPNGEGSMTIREAADACG